MAEDNIPPLDDWVAENYEGLVADENRNLTYKKIADDADAAGDRPLAAWARARAASKDVDVTPTGASYEAPDKVTRNILDTKSGDLKEVKFDITEPAEGAEELNEDGTIKPKKPAKK